jgi:hypothetical protein
MSCAVCGHVLTLVSNAFSERWIHSLEADSWHEPQPVPVGPETLNVCDFCLAEDPQWVLPVEAYYWAGGHNDGDWSACNGCAALLRKGDWEGLMTRALEGSRKRGAGKSTAPRGVLEILYAELRTHIKGEVRRA